MKAIVLAAGGGTRLEPLTYAIPKPLLPVAGRPTIDYVLDNLRSPEITDAYIAVSHQKEVIERYFEKKKIEGLNVHTVAAKKWETGGDLKMSAYDAGIDDTFIACFGDNITEIDITDMIHYHKSMKKALTIAFFPVPEKDVTRFGIADFNEDGTLKGFVEKPALKDAPSNLANAGYYVMEASVLDSIPYGKVNFEKEVIPKLVKEGQVCGFKINPPHWLDIGTMESYLAANKLILDKKGILAPPKNGVK